MQGANAQALNRYESEVFAEYLLTSNIQYGQSVKVTGSVQNLLLDIYEPKNDNIDKRPLIVYIHGGGFKSNSKVGVFSTMLCGNLAKCGYLVTSIDYRLSTTIANDQEHFEAMIRALQDAKAAVRFFVKNAALYKVDTTQIFVTGSSAGSITALHMAYLNQDEIPSNINMASLGTLEGSSGNPGYSSKIHAVVSNWGALANFRWMKEGDAPVYAVHGLADVTVPADSSFADGPFKYGSKIIVEKARNLGIPTGIILYPSTGHTLDNNTTKQADAYRHIAEWLYTILKLRVAPTLSPDLFDNDIAHNIEITFPSNQVWSDSITWVKVNGKPLKANIDFEVSSGKIILKLSGGNTMLVTAGSKNVSIEARGFQDASVVQEIKVSTHAYNKLFEDKVKVFASRDKLTVSINDNKGAYIELIDLMGRVSKSCQMSQTVQTMSIDCLKGVYIVRIQSAEGIYSKMLVLGLI
jgi:acetyl esterase/lipase